MLPFPSINLIRPTSAGQKTIILATHKKTTHRFRFLLRSFPNPQGHVAGKAINHTFTRQISHIFPLVTGWLADWRRRRDFYELETPLPWDVLKASRRRSSLGPSFGRLAILQLSTYVKSDAFAGNFRNLIGAHALPAHSHTSQKSEYFNLNLLYSNPKKIHFIIVEQPPFVNVYKVCKEL